VSLNKKSGIYKITGPNNRCYIGQSVNLSKRIGSHKHDLRRNIHSNGKLQNAWNKYGEEAFVFEAILLCAPEDLVEKEQYFMDLFNSVSDGYNIAPIAESGKGIKRPDMAERNRKQAGSLHPGFGRPRPDLALRNKLFPPNKGKTWNVNRKPIPTGSNHATYRNSRLREHDPEIIQLLQDGASLTSIAKKFSATVGSIRLIQEVNGLLPKQPAPTSTNDNYHLSA
jgi:group I intron endonuclease